MGGDNSAKAEASPMVEGQEQTSAGCSTAASGGKREGEVHGVATRPMLKPRRWLKRRSRCLNALQDAPLLPLEVAPTERGSIAALGGGTGTEHLVVGGLEQAPSARGRGQPAHSKEREQALNSKQVQQSALQKGQGEEGEVRLAVVGGESGKARGVLGKIAKQGQPECFASNVEAEGAYGLADEAWRKVKRNRKKPARQGVDDAIAKLLSAGQLDEVSAALHQTPGDWSTALGHLNNYEAMWKGSLDYGFSWQALWGPPSTALPRNYIMTVIS